MQNTDPTTIGQSLTEITPEQKVENQEWVDALPQKFNQIFDIEETPNGTVLSLRAIATEIPSEAPQGFDERSTQLSTLYKDHTQLIDVVSNPKPYGKYPDDPLFVTEGLRDALTSREDGAIKISQMGLICKLGSGENLITPDSLMGLGDTDLAMLFSVFSFAQKVGEFTKEKREKNKKIKKIRSMLNPQ
ncbi:MAG: hypothetical protein UR96_C0007G0007 [candidate division WS6 bacterium GW2011_GWC1_36_11]|uniref:Uncharacterized protein n=2 Tax=Candidatus Dojkabacteria TaxID=74243 RepID=A0A0G0DGY9_9BACT|nr:MAG: hypothetical protein UR96_C0007G0007 [candidate division WS6 bacterium GW2011_GWC1_36_11]KKQ04117.1 MAG: hypothetical protein US14_C0023G0006 [candidate division WS6 bacterium GW2011_WS6_36_26]KKQ15527.1 MAG: hypothetical protein US29_C0042G0005 [candidate division WS6 bacterium GW2011_GWF1_36_8]HAM37552.1 hypothetical protein [Patescibacteria group bacterium]HAM96534.1 hypothetical protein [Patescibacteria group bacterium]